MLLRLVFAIVFFTAVASLRAQSFTASASSVRIALDEQVELTFTYSGSDINGLSNFQPPAFRDFVTLSGPNQSTSMQIINGQVSGSRAFSYILQARGTGKFTIGSGSISAQGTVYKSQPFTIEVVAAGQKPKKPKDEPGISQSEIAENLFIRAVADKYKVRLGEQVTVTYKLYTRLNISSPQINKLPSYQGLWAEEIEMPRTINFSREVINGKQFNVALLKKVALFPSKTGELSVTPFDLKIPVVVERKRKGGGGFFDDFFNDPFFRQTETVEFDAVSNTIKLNVLPLPPTDEPSYNGAVGSFSLSAAAEPKTVKQNEPVNLKITVSGTGNIKLVDLPRLELPAGFEAYDPQTEETINRGGQISGSKTYKYLIIPRAAGEQQLPEIRFTFFNPALGKYTTLKAGPFPVTVSKGEAEYAGNNNTHRADEIRMLDEDIRFIKTRPSYSGSSAYLFHSPLYWVLVSFPLLTLVALAVFTVRKKKLSADVALVRRLRAEKVARARLKISSKLLSAGKQNEFYESISVALMGYMHDKFGIPMADFTVEYAVGRLRESGASDELAGLFQNTMNTCEFIRFAPVRPTPEGMNQLYESTSALIIALEGIAAAREVQHV